VHFVARGTNAGIAAATNDALAVASGDFCVFLDQGRPPRPVRALRVRGTAGADAVCRPALCDEDRINERGADRGPPSSRTGTRNGCAQTNYVLHPVAIRTALLQRFGRAQDRARRRAGLGPASARGGNPRTTMPLSMFRAFSTTGVSIRVHRRGGIRKARPQ
jgi:hypothetical protein